VELALIIITLLGGGAGLWYVNRRRKHLVVGTVSASSAPAVAGSVEMAADALVRRGQHRQAVELLTANGKQALAVEILVAAGDSVAAARMLASGHEYVRAGELFQQGGERRTAAAMFERGGALAAALSLYIDLKDADKTAELAGRVDGDARLLERAATCLQAQGDLLRAARTWIRAGKVDKGATILERLGRTAEAVAVLEEGGWLEAAAGLHSHLGQHRRAAYLLVRAGQWEKAASELVVDGDFLAAARILRKIGKLPAALDALRKMRPAEPAYRGGMMLASGILEDQGRLGEAVAILYDCLEHLGYSPENSEAIARLVELQWAYGDLAGARASLERAIAAGIESEPIDALLDELHKAPGDSVFEASGLHGSASGQGPRRSTGSSVGFPRSDRFHLVRRLGRGGNALIFHVVDRRNGQELALKLLFSDILPEGEARRYFEREARVASELRHPNIVRVLETGELEGRPYLTMEFVDGVNLLQVLEVPEPPTFRQRIGICVQLAEALSYAHGRGVVHRDVKLENVLVARNGQVKLTDFGLAKVIGEASVRSGFIVGTPSYMSPEQIAGKPLDARTDIYSFGVLMYRLFTGRYPYDPTETSIVTWPPSPIEPSKLSPAVPQALSELILKCLNKDLSLRFQTAAEVRSHLLPLGA